MRSSSSCLPLSRQGSSLTFPSAPGTASSGRLAFLDDLTGILNRSAFDRDCKTIAEQSDITFVMFDINGLKSTNDTWGHVISIRQRMHERCRSSRDHQKARKSPIPDFFGPLFCPVPDVTEEGPIFPLY